MAALVQFSQILIVLLAVVAAHPTKRLRLNNQRQDAGSVMLQQGVSTMATSASIKHMLRKIQRPDHQVELGKMVLKSNTNHGNSTENPYCHALT